MARGMTARVRVAGVADNKEAAMIAPPKRGKELFPMESVNSIGNYGHPFLKIKISALFARLNWVPICC